MWTVNGGSIDGVELTELFMKFGGGEGPSIMYLGFCHVEICTNQVETKNSTQKNN